MVGPLGEERENQPSYSIYQELKMRVIHGYTLIFLGITLIASCNSVPVPYYMKQKQEYGSSRSYSTTVHGRLRRAPCEVSLFYDVACHGLCPPYKEDWEKNRLYMNCTDGLSYHCAKDYTTGEYVEACAEPVRCERGKEPRIVFPAGHEKTAIVVCRYCDNENFYNPYELKLSSTYYKCPKWKSRCDRNVGQINCDYERGVERYYTNYKCRCDVRKGYIQELAVCPTESPCQEASDLKCVPHQCDPTSDNISQELLKDYCCAPVCDKGYQRNETSDMCDPISSTLSAATTWSYIRTTATKPKTETNAIQTHIETTVTVTTEASSVPKENTSTTATPNTDTNGSVLPLVIISSIVLGAVITGILVYGIYRTRHRNKRKPNKKQDNGYNLNHGGQGAPINDEEMEPFIENGINQHDEAAAQVEVNPSHEREQIRTFHETGDENDAHGIASQNWGIHEQDEDHNGESVTQNSRIIPANHNDDYHHNPTPDGQVLQGDNTGLTEVEVHRHDVPSGEKLVLDGRTPELPVANDSGALSSNEQGPDHSSNQENGCHICGIHSADICIDCDKKLCRNCDITWHKHPSRQRACRRFEETQDFRPLASNQNQDNENHYSGEVLENPEQDQGHRGQNMAINSPVQRVNVTTPREDSLSITNGTGQNQFTQSTHESSEVKNLYGSESTVKTVVKPSENLARSIQSEDHGVQGRTEDIAQPRGRSHEITADHQDDFPTINDRQSSILQSEESIQNRCLPSKTVSVVHNDKCLPPRTHTQERETGNQEIKITLPEKDQHNIDEMKVRIKFKTSVPTQTSTRNTTRGIIDDSLEGNIPRTVPTVVGPINIEDEHDEETGHRLEDFQFVSD